MATRLGCLVCQASMLFFHRTPSSCTSTRLIFSQIYCRRLRYLQNQGSVSFSYNVRWYSTAGKPPSGGFIKNFINNLRKSLEKDKQIQTNLKAFEEERSRVVKSDAVKLFRQRITSTKEWLITYSLFIIDTMRNGALKTKDNLIKLYGKVIKSDIGKKGQVVGDQVTKSAQDAAKKISETTTVLGKTDAYKTISKGAETVKEELIDDIIKESAPYQPPEQILKRSERVSSTDTEAVGLQPDDDTKDIIVTRRSKWRQKWQSLRENNPVSNLFYGMKMRYDESDHLVVRASRTVTDKIGDAFGGVMTQSDMAEALAEIHKIDPNFNKETFIKECQFEIIPTILEAYLQGRQDILKDWCHEGSYNVLSALIKQRTDKANHQKVLEVRDVDILGAKLLDRGPVMILAFNAQQLTREIDEDIKNEVLENVFYVWALCRDQSIYDPRIAWRVLEFGIQASGKLLI